MTFYTQAGPSLKWSDGFPKIISSGHGLFGGVGAVTVHQEFLNWVLEDDMDPKKFPVQEAEKVQFSGIGIIDGEVLEWEAGPRPITFKYEYSAWGSGREVAMGALAAGANAIEAVAAACKHSPGTDYPIQVLFSGFQTKGKPEEPFLITKEYYEKNIGAFFQNNELLYKYLKEQLATPTKQTTKNTVAVPRPSKLRVEQRRSSVSKTKRK